MMRWYVLISGSMVIEKVKLFHENMDIACFQLYWSTHFKMQFSNKKFNLLNKKETGRY